MKTSFLLKSAVVLLAATLLFAGCASSTMINSTPSGAKVVINGEAVGVTPYLYTDTKIVGSLVTLDLTLEGYEPSTPLSAGPRNSMWVLLLAAALFGLSGYGPWITRLNTIMS